MAGRRTQNAAYANIQGSIAAARPFGYLGHPKNHRPVIAPDLLTTTFFSIYSSAAVLRVTTQAAGA